MIPERSADITPEYLNEVLHTSGSLGGADIEAIALEPIGVGEGFVSEIVRLHVTYDRTAAHLPKTMIAKLPTSYESAHEMAMQYNLYEREIRFYLEVAGQSPIRTPRLIYGDADADGKRYILLIEDCGGYIQYDQLNGLDLNQTELVIRKLADFHAYWWDADRLHSFPWMPKPRGPESIALIDTYRSCWDASVESQDFLSSLPEGGKQAGLDIYDHYHWLIDTTPDDHLTISHFDFRADNLFFDASNSEEPVVIFDWQAANVNRGVIDVSYFLGFSLPRDLRRRAEEDIVKLYYERLIAQGVEGYAYDQCRYDYLWGLLIYAYLPVLVFATLDISDERGSELARIAVRRIFSSIVDNDATDLLPR